MHQGIPSEDIIWQNVGRIKQESTCTGIVQFFKPLIISIFAIFSILLLEVFSLHYMPKFSPFVLYITSTMLVLYAFYATPYLVFDSVQNERHAQKSLHEKAYMRRLAIIELLNVIVVPILFNILIVLYGPELYRGRTPEDMANYKSDSVYVTVDIIAFTEELLLRFLLQAIVVIIFFQWQSDPRKILKTFLSSFMITGRNKFKHYLYDLGLRNVLAVTMFTLGLACSVIVPLALPICAVAFYFTYAIDKYNLFFVYPIDFES